VKSPANNLIHQDIDAFYSETSEESRLQLGLGPLEFARNKYLIQRYLPMQGVIIDVGGGPGVYSEWLAGLGHNVHLVDPVEKHIKQAEKRSAKLKNRFKSYLGEARKLDFPNTFADVVILHGPLYHLPEKADRLAAIAEAKRVLKPGGMILGFAINYAASTIPGLLNGLMDRPDFLQMCLDELTTGNHNAPKSMPGVLPHAYYHRPEQLKAEFAESGLQFLGLHAVEGVVWLDKNYFINRADNEKKKIHQQLLDATESDEGLLALSPHMMIACRK